MVVAENISTFAKLIDIVQYILKQMTLKYFYRSLSILLWVLILSSCLNSNNQEFDPSKDAQIYSFNVSSTLDSNKYFDETKFSIDQVNGLIFNRDSLPYLFNVDSILVNIGNMSGLSDITFKLIENDSTYKWNGKDSVAMRRLKTIETTAGDGKTKLKYDISINIHQQDPYIIDWSKMANNYLEGTPVDQITIFFKDQFITYYKSNSLVKASVSSASEGKTWNEVNVSGLPVSIKLSSILSVLEQDAPALYAIDNNKKVHTSTDGVTWNEINSDYSVRTIYGELPFITGEFAILVAVEDEGVLKFATTEDFETFEVLNELANDMPLDNFSAVTYDNPSVYAAKYILIYGGENSSGISKEKMWIVQKEEDKIKVLPENIGMNIQSAELFLYDNKVYMLASDGDENKLYYSSNYGLTWSWGGENQAIDKDMVFRNKASVITDSNNFIWIFGGESKSKVQIVDAWRGRLNKLAK